MIGCTRRWAHILACTQLTALFTLAACDVEPPTQDCPLPGERPVYVTLYSHNEDTWEPWVGTRADYVAYRENLVERLHLIRDFGAKLNWQSDLVVLQAMAEQEDDSLAALTGGMNILAYIQHLGFSVDPHGHLFDCNYADLAHYIRQLDVEPSGVIGGLPLQDCGSSHLGFLDLRDWRAEIELDAAGVIHGRNIPQATWRPTLLSVPGMPGHWFDELSTGLWRPSAGTDFYTHDPQGEIVYVGQGYPHDIVNLGPTQASGAVVYAERGAYIKELVAKARNDTLPVGVMLTASIHVRDCETVRDNAALVDVNQGLAEILSILAPLAADGDIVYATYQEAVAIWEEIYAGAPGRVDFSHFSLYADVRDQAAAHCGAKN